MSPLLKDLSRSTGLSEHQLLRVIRNAPEKYKRFRILKRSGGYRQISQPAKELKFLQRTLAKLLLSNLPIHRSAVAYRTGLSIRENALAHVNSGPILKMDFKDFFLSIREEDWRHYCQKTSILQNSEDIYYSTQIFFHRPVFGHVLRLAIGAPSSPILSNILMYEFDTIISDKVAKDKVIYTRYADDLTFSASRTGFLTSVPKTIRQITKEITSPNLVLNNKKTALVTKKYGRKVTGLTLSNAHEVTIGRDRKRIIRAQINYFLRGLISTESLQNLAGMIAFAKSAEPDYFVALVERYGADLIEEILTSQSTNQKNDQ